MTTTKPRAWWRSWYLAWPTALLVAAVITPWVALRVPIHGVSPDAMPPPGDRVSAAVAGLRADHFYVAPEVAYRLTAAERAQIAEVLKSAKAPAYLVFWNSQGDQGYWIEPDALDQIMTGVGVDGHYAIVNEKQRDTYDSRGMTDPYVDTSILEQRLGPGLLDYAKAMAAMPAEPESAPFDYWGGVGGGFAAGLLMVGLGFPVLLGLVAVVGVLVRRIR